jgi:hypothetical protein
LNPDSLMDGRLPIDGKLCPRDAARPEAFYSNPV